MWQKSVVPGPTKLIGGNLQAGFYGEVPAKDFITGDELARRIGLTAGKSQYSNEPWLKFSYLGKVEFVAKKTFRFNITRNDINSANAIYGNRTININGLTFKVRLFKGKTEGKQNDQSAYEGTINHNSEWNRLMLPIHQKAPSKWYYKDNVNSPTENWNVGYTNEDLMTRFNTRSGTRSWCQEYGESSSYRLYRGKFDISDSGSYSPNYFDPDYGWRPVLELVN